MVPNIYSVVASFFNRVTGIIGVTVVTIDLDTAGSIIGYNE